ncbi:transcriptional regulator, IclR family [Halogranum rubrum]|uniref:Transcriptional regulator, IclR family n=1 Tax=Halogranum rubrum TaxID=553466 RepID=A0A1I4GY15_9EURY|nr:IclR family transcriptional regulator [Halogranum rubrum]SFL34894.1 transcriptional regulator, IclR family [Halogranum rubrum]
MDSPTQPREVQATKTSFRLIEAIQESGGAGVSELASRLDLAKSTVVYHLTTLERQEYLVQEGSEYHLGLRFFKLGQDAMGRRLPDAARKKVKDLAAKTDAEADYSVEEYGYIVLLYDQADSSAEPGFKTGSHHRMHNNAAGKAILATWDDSRVDEYVTQVGLPTRTEHTIGSRAELLEELAQVREQGYALNDEEYMRGYRSVSMVVDDADGGVYGALTVGGPSYRVSRETLQTEFRVPLAQAVDELRTELESSYPR